MERVIVFLILFSPLTLLAQKSKHFEFEIGGGINFGYQTKKYYPHGSYKSSGDLILELRYNMSDKIDFGVQFLRGLYYIETGSEEDKVSHSIFQAIADYNFRPLKRINPYAGIGIGMNHVNYSGTYTYDTTDASICFNPRVGAEFFRRFRLTMDYRILPFDSNFFNLTVGVVIGGGMKKT